MFAIFKDFLTKKTKVKKLNRKNKPHTPPPHPLTQCLPVFWLNWTHKTRVINSQLEKQIGPIAKISSRRIQH